MSKLTQVRLDYIDQLATEYELNVAGCEKFYNRLIDDGLIDYDTEKEIFLDE